MSIDSIFNTELLNMARRNVRNVTEKQSSELPNNPHVRNIRGAIPREKLSFVPAGGMGGGGMPPMDPAAMGGGGMPPMDPMAMGGGMPPMDPAAMGGGGGGTSALEQKIDQLISVMGAGGGAGGPSGLKPKIDVNVTLVQMQKMLARIMDTMGISMPMSEMITTAPDLNNAAQQQQATGTIGSDGGQAIKPIAPLEGLQGAGVPGGQKAAMHERGRPVDRTTQSLDAMTDGSRALLLMRQRQAA